MIIPTKTPIEAARSSFWIGSFIIILTFASKFLVYKYLSIQDPQDYREDNPVVCFIPLIVAALLLISKRPAWKSLYAARG